MAEHTVTAYIGVGSNIEPERNIPRALDLLKQHVAITGCSTFYRTAALGRREQPAFLNGVWRIETSLPVGVLKFDVLRSIEAELGRKRTDDKYAARPIDLDVLLYGDSVIDEPGLKVPDPDIRTRSFISVPLVELDPQLVLPDTHETLASLVDSGDASAMEPDRGFTQYLREKL